MSARGMRSRDAVLSVLLVLLVTACAVFAVVLGERHAARVDLGGGGDRALSERTMRVLARVPAGSEVILAIDPRSADRASLERMRDVLGDMDRASPGLRWTEIDTATARGGLDAKAALDRLAQRDADDFGTYVTTLSQAVSDAMTLAGQLDRLAADLGPVRDGIGTGTAGAAQNRAYFDQQAALSRVAARELRAAAPSLQKALDEPALFGSIPDAYGVADALRKTILATETQLASLAGDLEATSRADTMPAAARAAAGGPARTAARLRDDAAVIADTIARAQAPSLVDAARALQTGQTVLVVGPSGTGVAAIDPDTLLPASEVLDQAGVSASAVVAQRTEELVASALDRVLSGPGPIVVLVHGEAEPGVIESPLFTGLKARLRDRGFDLLEWAAAIDGSPPSTASIDPGGTRPVVFVTLSPDSTAASRGDPEMSGASRAGRLGAVVSRLIEAGDPVLLSVGPSIFPTFGDTDPIARPIEAFGLSAKTGTPILTRTTAGSREVVNGEIQPIGVDTGSGKGAANASHPIAGAVRGLRALLSWAVPIEIVPSPPSGVVGRSPLVTLAPAENVWAEREWIGLWRTPRDQRAFLLDPPRADAGEGLASSAVVAVAAERELPGSLRRGRIVVVGSNGWYLDALALKPMFTDGRPGLAHPANIELFEASVAWLAGLDAQIAASPEAMTTSTIQAVSGERMAIYRWLLVAGVPVGVLLLGVGWRAAFG